MNSRYRISWRSRLELYLFRSRRWTVSFSSTPLPHSLTHHFLTVLENKSALCEFYLNGVCSRGTHCPFRHMRGERTVVCKHWMRHLCKKGDDCEFLHEYEMSKMPVCYFFQRFGECTNKDCQYLHVDADTLKIRDCAWYDRGFCKHGMWVWSDTRLCPTDGSLVWPLLKYH